MIRAAMFLVLVVACDGGGSSGPPSVLQPPTPPTAVVVVPRPSGVPPSATTGPRAEQATPPVRPPPLRVAPTTVAGSWPSYLGRRIRLQCKPVRRIDFTRTLVVAGGERFVIVGSPDFVPCGPTTSTFTVIGSSTVALSGRTVLPELLLDQGDGEDGAR